MEDLWKEEEEWGDLERIKLTTIKWGFLSLAGLNLCFR